MRDTVSLRWLPFSKFHRQLFIRTRSSSKPCVTTKLQTGRGQTVSTDQDDCQFHRIPKRMANVS